MGRTKGALGKLTIAKLAAAAAAAAGGAAPPPPAKKAAAKKAPAKNASAKPKRGRPVGSTKQAASADAGVERLTDDGTFADLLKVARPLYANAKYIRFCQLGKTQLLAQITTMQAAHQHKKDLSSKWDALMQWSLENGVLHRQTSYRPEEQKLPYLAIFCMQAEMETPEQISGYDTARNTKASRTVAAQLYSINSVLPHLVLYEPAEMVFKARDAA